MGDFQIFRCKSTRQGRAGLTPAVVDVRGGPWSLRFWGFVPLGQRMPETILILFPQLRSGPSLSK